VAASPAAAYEDVIADYRASTGSTNEENDADR
jgi:hypothetical protein